MVMIVDSITTVGVPLRRRDDTEDDAEEEEYQRPDAVRPSTSRHSSLVYYGTAE